LIGLVRQMATSARPLLCLGIRLLNFSELFRHESPLVSCAVISITNID
jgi:hypothetical protein